VRRNSFWPATLDFAKRFVTVFALAASLPQAASSFICQDNDQGCPDAFADRRGSTMFDLGVDVSNVSPTKQDVSQFMRTLTPDGQTIIGKTCQNYVRDPRQVRSARTIEFCRVLLGR
jgi:hypothetical protein